MILRLVFTCAMSLGLAAMLGAPAKGAAAAGADNPVIAAIMARRSIRVYEAKPVPASLLKLVAQCGINAPSARNTQPWAVRVVTNSAFISKATEIYLSHNPGAGKAPTFKNVFRNAPAVIFVAALGDGAVDCGMLGENMLLAAQSLGLGTCVLGGIVDFMNKEAAMKPLLEELRLPEGASLLYAIAIGYPAQDPAAQPRDEAKIRFIE